MKGPILELLSYFMGEESMIVVIQSFFSVLVILFLVFPFRAFARGWVAKQLGDDTAEQYGMLTMNPLVHIDWMGALCMGLCCIGWSKQVPISFNRCRKVSQNTAVTLISLTGPLSLFVLGFILMIIAKVILVLVASETAVYIALALVMASQICAYLAVLNLIPVPPFDGYYIFAGILPRKAAIWLESNAHIFNSVILVLLISNVLTKPLYKLSMLMLGFMDILTAWIMDLAIV